MALLQAGDVAAIEAHLSAEVVAPPETAEKFKQETRCSWNVFYQQKAATFFKDRNYLRKELPELMPRSVVEDPWAWQPVVGETGGDSKRAEESHEQSEEALRLGIPRNAVVLEVGCGVGNTVFPLLRANPLLRVLATDFSSAAISLVKSNPEYEAAGDRCRAFVCDVSREALTPSHVEAGTVNFVTMVFMLSAVHPSMMAQTLSNVHACLAPGGIVYFRDYARHDLPQLRYPEGAKLQDNFYVRGDGTGAHYFSTEEITALFSDAGFDPIGVDYVHREIVNRKKALTMKRIWVQARFRKR